MENNNPRFEIYTSGLDADEGGHYFSQTIGSLEVVPDEPVYIRETYRKAKKDNPGLPLLIDYWKNDDGSEEINPEDYFKGEDLIGYLKDKIEIQQSIIHEYVAKENSYVKI